MNTFFTFCILISLLNDIFEFNCQDMFAATCNSRLASVTSPAATDIIFVKDLALPGWFMKFAWSLLTLFTAATTAKAVAMAILLASIAAVALFCHFKPEKPLFIKYTESRDDLIQMIDISIAHVCVNKKPLPHPALDNEPVEPIKALPLASAPLESSPYLVNVGDLFHESPQVSTAPARRMSYADAVGYEFMEVRTPRNPNVLGYDVNIADLFGMDDDPFAHIPAEESLKSNFTNEWCVQVPVHRMSYADAVGYEFMEVKKPRHPNVLGYDVYLGDLFPDDSATEDSQKPSLIPYRCIETPPVPARRMSYADAVGYDFMEVKKPRNAVVLGYDVYIAGLFELEDIPSVTSSSPAINEISNEECINTCPDSSKLARRFSYAEAVGYEFMETRGPRYSHTIVSYAYMGDLFAEEEITNISPSPSARRLSYAEAVGYDNMEINKPRYSHAIESSAYLGYMLTEHVIGLSAVENHKNYYFIETV